MNQFNISSKLYENAVLFFDCVYFLSLYLFKFYLLFKFIGFFLSHVYCIFLSLAFVRLLYYLPKYFRKDYLTLTNLYICVLKNMFFLDTFAQTFPAGVAISCNTRTTLHLCKKIRATKYVQQDTCKKIRATIQIFY